MNKEIALLAINGKGKSRGEKKGEKGRSKAERGIGRRGGEGRREEVRQREG